MSQAQSDSPASAEQYLVSLVSLALAEDVGTGDETTRPIRRIIAPGRPSPHSEPVGSRHSAEPQLPILISATVPRSAAV
jgi:hypothetical protein